MSSKCINCNPMCGECDDLCECPECGMDYRETLEPNTVYICSHCGTELMQRGHVNELTTYWGDFWEEGEGDTAPRITLTRGGRDEMSAVGRMLFGAMQEMNQAMFGGGR